MFLRFKQQDVVGNNMWFFSRTLVGKIRSAWGRYQKRHGLFFKERSRTWFRLSKGGEWGKWEKPRGEEN